MAEPDWAKVLNHLYKNNGVYHLPLDPDVGNNAGVRANLLFATASAKMNLRSLSSSRELRSLFSHIENVGLVEVVNASEWGEIRLTEIGFEVAHERELNKRQNNTNRILAALTAGLFFAAALQALAAYYAVPESDQFGMFVGSIVFGIAAISLVYVITTRR